MKLSWISHLHALLRYVDEFKLIWQLSEDGRMVIAEFFTQRHIVFAKAHMAVEASLQPPANPSYFF